MTNLYDWQMLREIRGVVNRALEELRVRGEISRSLNAGVKLLYPAQMEDFVHRYYENRTLHEVLSVSLLIVERGELLAANVWVVSNEACQRCLRRSEVPEEHVMWPGVKLCSRCVRAGLETGWLEAHGRALGLNYGITPFPRVNKIPNCV